MMIALQQWYALLFLYDYTRICLCFNRITQYVIMCRQWSPVRACMEVGKVNNAPKHRHIMRCCKGARFDLQLVQIPGGGVSYILW